MSYKTIYHGSNKKVIKPIYHYEHSNKHNDYGLGFYCTQNFDMAKEWANRNTTNGFANKYKFDDRNLNILDLTDKNKYNVLHWIAILLHHRELEEEFKVVYKEELAFMERYYIDVTQYDVIIGYRADDAYFRFPKMFVTNALTYKRLESIYHNGNLGKQYVLISEKAFSHIKFVNAILVDSIYHDRYVSRKDAADNSYRRIELEDRKSKDKKIRDLMNEYD